MKAKKCKNPACGKKFTPAKPLQAVCGWECARDYGKVLNEKKARKERREAKEKLKSRRDWLREAQSACNQYIRERDKQEPCISCRRYHTGQYHAGHYRTIGANPELRFNEFNIHKQCSACNNHLHGNLINYRINLIKKIGQDKVDWLEGKHEPKKYSIDDLKEIKALYKQKIKEMK